MPNSEMELFDRFASYYDGDYRDYDDDIDLILELAEQCDGPVIELGCGTGRVMLPLVKAGRNVTGVDVSPMLMAVAQRKLSDLSRDSLWTLVHADLVDFNLPEKRYSLAICTSNTLMHLNSPETQMALLRNAHNHLAPGGWILIDLFSPDVARLLAVNGLVEMADEWDDASRHSHVVKWSVRTVDFAEQLQDTLFIYEETGADRIVRRTYCPFTLRFLWRHEAELMLTQCGFQVDVVWGDFNFGEYLADSERLVLLARKV